MELGGNGQDRVGNVEGDMGQQQSGKAGLDANEKEQQHQGDAGDEVRTDVGNVGQGHDQAAQARLHGMQADAGDGGHGRGDDGRKNSHNECNLQGVEDIFIMEELEIPVKREAAPDGAGFCRVKGENNQYQDWRVEKDKDQGHIEFIQPPGHRGSPALLSPVSLCFQHLRSAMSGLCWRQETVIGALMLAAPARG